MIEIQQITKKYNDMIVFEKYNLKLQKGKTTTIIGKSGCGKTTLLRLLMGLETVDSGKINGIDNLNISAVFQEDRLIDSLSIYKNICLPHMNKDKLPSREKVQQIVNSLHVNADIKKKTGELSGGMKRRVAIIRAMLAEFDMLILDEPFKGLDDETKYITMNFVKEYAKGNTVVLVTHDKKEIQFFDSCVIEL